MSAELDTREYVVTAVDDYCACCHAIREAGSSVVAFQGQTFCNDLCVQKAINSTSFDLGGEGGFA